MTDETDPLTAMIAALDQAAADLRANYRTGDRSIEYINGFEDAAELAEGWAAAGHQARLAAGTEASRNPAHIPFCDGTCRKDPMANCPEQPARLAAENDTEAP